MEPITAGVIWGVIAGLFGDQINEEITNNIIKKNIKSWLQKTSRPVNHDIEKAIRTATLNATLIFLKEYIERHKEKKIFLKITPTELKQLKKYLQDEKNKLTKQNFIPSEILFNYDIEDLLKPNKYSLVKVEFKKSILSELKNNIKILPNDFENSILNGIEIDNIKVDWYELMSSFFVETVKTNERVKTAIENDFLTTIKEDLKSRI